MSSVKNHKVNLSQHTSSGVFDEDFLLENKWAKLLYHGYAAKMPIVDYHNHLSPELIANNHQYENITQLWLEGDHYKWRALRANGVSEKFITGDASDEEKFNKWAETVPNTLRNPLFHWTHLELKKPFGVETYLNGHNASAIYQECNSKLKGLTVPKLLQNYNVKVVCTTDDPIDDLKYHKQIKASDLPITVLPTFRPDQLLGIEKGEVFSRYLEILGDVVGFKITSFEEMIEALKLRHDYFATVGCKLTDIGLEYFPVAKPDKAIAAGVFSSFMKGDKISKQQVDEYKAAVLHEVGCLNADKGWIQQFHAGPIRNNNTRMMQAIGADGGFDSIGDLNQIDGMSVMLDSLEMKEKLSKTIAYNLNPSLNDAFATMLGNFNDGSCPGKMQYGAAWWFMDQKKGMEAQLDTLSNMGLLSRFVGMLTDSRSFVSFSRHEYFRRILCNVLGKEMVSGEIPADEKWVGKMVQDICYNNAINYFGFETK